MRDSTLEQQIRAAIDALKQTSPSPGLDAEVLAMLAFKRDRAGLIRDGRTLTREADTQRFLKLIDRRVRGEPVAYITGVREFWSLELTVNPSVLIPRPDTELLVERALVLIDEFAQNRPADANMPICIADLGTGSGAIAIAIAHERPHCRLVATDCSQAALTVARQNADRHGTHHIEFRIGDWVDALAEREFDLIVSNPPYITADDPHLHHGDVAHEPGLALVGGNSGLQAFRRIIESAPTVLKDAGILLLEHGYDQGSEVRELCRDNGFGRIQSHSDLAGRQRVTEAQLD